MNTKTQGTVKFYNTEKRFGFIKPDGSGKDVFIHASGLIDQVAEGDHVEYEVQESPKGLSAVNVKKIG